MKTSTLFQLCVFNFIYYIEECIQVHAYATGIGGGQNITGTGFSTNTSSCHSVIPIKFYININLFTNSNM